MKTLDPQAIWILAGVRPSRRRSCFRDHQSPLSTGAGQFTQPEKTRLGVGRLHRPGAMKVAEP
jgi:hypothetical protein